MQLEAPEKANQVVAQIMAEMRETQRQESKTLAEKIVDGILTMNLESDQNNKLNSKQDFWWAARPAGRV